MKKISLLMISILAVVDCDRLFCQSKIGFINLGELISAMPEFKRADTLYAEFNNSLNQQFAEYKSEYVEQDSMLNSKDTAKYTKPQLAVKKENLLELQSKLQHFGEQAQQLLDRKHEELLAPIQKKALDAIRIVSKDYGYNFVFEKQGLYIYPEAGDLLPLVREKLGLK